MSVNDDESSFFWTGLHEHRLLLQRCTGCGRHRFPPMPSCPWCGALGGETVESTGDGSVYSWITVHRAFDERWAADVPYVIAAIDLGERCRVFARIEAEPDAITAGLPVRARFVDHDDWTELRFAPSIATAIATTERGP